MFEPSNFANELHDSNPILAISPPVWLFANIELNDYDCIQWDSYLKHHTQVGIYRTVLKRNLIS